MAGIFDGLGGEGEAASQWTSFFQKPENRSALLQFGVAMLQPQYGSNLPGAVGRAIGEGAGARDRNLAGQQEVKAREAAAQQQGFENTLAAQKAQNDATRAQAAMTSARRPLSSLLNPNTTARLDASADQDRASAVLKYVTEKEKLSLDEVTPELRQQWAQEAGTMYDQARGGRTQQPAAQPQVQIGDVITNDEGELLQMGEDGQWHSL